MDMTDICLRLFAAFALGGIIGFERELEKRGKNAGLRTHILVALGACLFMLISLYMYEIYKGAGNVDPSRIASNVVTGIGFLGAGAIIISGREHRIQGLTTAASIWVSSAIGIAVGCGFIKGAVVATLLAVFALAVLKPFERKHIDQSNHNKG